MPNRDENTKKIIGATVAGVLLITFLLVVIIIQLVQMGVKKSEIERENAEIARLEEAIASEEIDLEYYRSSEYLEMQAWKKGYR